MPKISNYVKYGYRQNITPLTRSLQTQVSISAGAFEKMLRTNNYYLYGFDPQVNQILWLNKNSETWLFIQVESYTNEESNGLQSTKK